MEQTQAPQQQQTPIKPGAYPAKIKDYGVGRTKSGNPQIMITFGIVEDGQSRSITSYQGITTEKQAKFTAAVLATLGMTSNDPSLLAKGKAGGALNTTKEFEITVKHDVNESTGKTYHAVEWINDPEESKLRGTLSEMEAKQALSGFAGFLAEARQAKGTAIKNYAPGAQASSQGPDPQQIDTNAEIPF